MMADVTVKSCGTEFYKSTERALAAFVAKLARSNSREGDVYTCVLECENEERFYSVKLSDSRPVAVVTDGAPAYWIRFFGTGVMFHEGDAGTVIDKNKVFI